MSNKVSCSRVSTEINCFSGPASRMNNYPPQNNCMINTRGRKEIIIIKYQIV